MDSNLYKSLELSGRELISINRASNDANNTTVKTITPDIKQDSIGR